MSDSICLISDIHGSAYTLLRLLNKVVVSHPGARLILLGDLIDRGPHSRKVVEFAMQNKIPTCRANHDDMALAFYGRKAKCAREYANGVWLNNGGDKAVRNWPTVDKRALESWEVTQAKGLGGRLPDEVMTWFESLPAYIIPDAPQDDKGLKLLASHTGYGLAADQGNWFRALWGRHAHGGGDFPEDGYYRVYGHTSVKEAVVTETWANIDTGAAYPERGGGTMTAFIWPTKQVVTQPFDETPVEPRFTMVDGCVTP